MFGDPTPELTAVAVVLEGEKYTSGLLKSRSEVQLAITRNTLAMLAGRLS
jgi:hypothetical protein